MKDQKIQVTSINLFKVFCAYLVVAIHVHPFQEISSNLKFLFTDIIPRIAVPFFFIISGFFYFDSLLNFKKNTLKYLKKLFFTYSIWSFIYISLSVVYKLKKGNIDLKLLVKDIFISFFITGSWYHFWFFPALIICIIIAYISYKFKLLKNIFIFSLILYLVGLLGTSYYELGKQIPILNSFIISKYFLVLRRIFFMGFPFFMIGYLLNIQKNFFSIFNTKTFYKIFVLNIFLFLIEIFLVKYLNIQDNIIITLFLYPLCLLICIFLFKHPTNNFSKFEKLFKYISNLTYYIHPLVIIFLDLFFTKILKINLSETPMFFLVCITTTLAAYIINKYKNQFIIKLIS